MKKKRFMGLLALASCVTLLTGCESDALWGLGGYWNSFVEWGKGVIGIKDDSKDEKESGKQEESEEEVLPSDEPVTPIVATLDVAELPESVDVRKSIDLDDYVTLFGVDSYTVTLAAESEELASVEGHVISVVGEGEIKFTVAAGSLSESCSITSVSSSRARLQDYFANAGEEYEVVLREYYEADGDDPAGWYTTDIVTHGKNFVSYASFALDDYQHPTKYVPGGFLAFDELDAFMFGLSETESGVEVFDMAFDMNTASSNYGYPVESANPVNISPSYFTSCHGAFNVDFSKLERVYDSELGEDLFVLEGTNGADAYEFAKICLGQRDGDYNFGKGSSGEALYGDIVKVEFASINVNSGTEAPEYVNIGFVYAEVPEELSESEETELELVYTVYFYAGEDYEGIPELDAVIEQGKPQLPDYSDIVSQIYSAPAGSLSLEKLLLGSPVYGNIGTIKLEFGWAQYNSSTYSFDFIGNAPASVGDSLMKYMPAYGSKMVFTSDTSVWEVEPQYDLTDPENPVLAGYAPLSGTFEVVDESGEEPVTSVYDVFVSEGSESGYFVEESDYASAWANKKLTYSEFAKAELYGAGAISNFDPGLYEVPVVDEETGEPTGETEYEYYGSTFVLNSWREGSLFSTLYASSDDLGIGEDVYETYLILGGLDIHSFYDIEVFVNPNYSYTQFTFSLGWDGTNYYVMQLTFKAANVTSFTSAWESNFASLIN